MPPCALAPYRAVLLHSCSAIFTHLNSQESSVRPQTPAEEEKIGITLLDVLRLNQLALTLKYM